MRPETFKRPDGEAWRSVTDIKPAFSEWFVIGLPHNRIGWLLIRDEGKG